MGESKNRGQMRESSNIEEQKKKDITKNAENNAKEIEEKGI